MILITDKDTHLLVEAVGAHLALAIESVAIGGTEIQFGHDERGMPAIPVGTLVKKEVQIIGELVGRYYISAKQPK